MKGRVKFMTQQAVSVCPVPTPQYSTAATARCVESGQCYKKLNWMNTSGDVTLNVLESHRLQGGDRILLHTPHPLHVNTRGWPSKLIEA